MKIKSVSTGKTVLERMLCSTADVAAQPPCAAFEGGEKIEPYPGFSQHSITGGHCQVEKAGDREKLHQTSVTVVPAKTPQAGAAVTPENGTRAGGQDECADEAEYAQTK